MGQKFTANTWFVTGATGLVGSTVIKTLRKNDLHVIALVRESSPQSMIDFLIDMDAKLVYGDLLDPTTYEMYLPTCDVVMHTAGAVQVKEKEKNWDVNLRGTELLCDQMVANSLDRLIHISTAGVYGKPYKQKVTEDIKPHPYGPYLESKYAAERLIEDKYPTIDSTIIRPPFIFGDPDCDRHVYKTLVDNLPESILPKVWRYNPRIGFVHAEDIARLVLQVGSVQKTRSMIYNVQSFDIDLEKLYEMVNEARNSNPTIIPIPYFLLYFLAMIGDFINNIRGTPFGYRQRLSMVRRNWTFSTVRAREELGFEPIHLDANELERLMHQYYLSAHLDSSDEVDITQYIEQTD